MGKKGRVRRRAVALVCAALACAPLSAEASLRSDPALARALDLEARGDGRLAAEAYRAWLDAHPPTPAASASDLYVEALLRFYALEPDARLVQHYLASAPLSALTPAAKARVLDALATLLDSLGEVAAAQAAYEEAILAQGDRDGEPARRSLLRSAALLYEQGVLDRAEAQAREVLDRSLGRRDVAAAADSRYLLGRIYAASGRDEEATGAWRAVLEEAPASAAAPRACLGLWVLLTSLDRRDEATSALALLEAHYPGSPELELARLARTGSGRALATPGPSALLEPRGLPSVSVSPEPAASTPTPAPAAQPAAAPARSPESSPASGPVAVLAGSYTSRDNADRHASDLAARGFAARIVEATVGGKRYYRVLVGETTTQEAATALIQRLKDAGFESVPLATGEAR